MSTREAEKRPGRPPIAAGESSTRIAVTVAASAYDRAHAAAAREGVSVPEILRRGLARVLLEDEDA